MFFYHYFEKISVSVLPIGASVNQQPLFVDYHFMTTLMIPIDDFMQIPLVSFLIVSLQIVEVLMLFMNLQLLVFLPFNLHHSSINHKFVYSIPEYHVSLIDRNRKLIQIFQVVVLYLLELLALVELLRMVVTF